jgi:uridine phosphorylase
LSAEQMIEFRRAQGGLVGHGAPHGVVLCLYRGVARRLAWRYRFRRVRGFLGDLYIVEAKPRDVGVMVNVGIGAPAIVNLAEELIAWGTRRLVTLSLAGAIQPQLSPGSIVVCDRAIRDEGTSYHYLPPAHDVRASGALVVALSRALAARGVAHATGAIWSTDAPYRETQAEAERFRAEGVQAVDMESAGLFAAGEVKGAETASVVVVGDSLAGSRWKAPPDMRFLHERLTLLLAVLVEALHEGG